MRRPLIIITIFTGILLIAGIIFVAIDTKKSSNTSDKVVKVTPFRINNLDNDTFALQRDSQNSIISSVKYLVSISGSSTTNVTGEVREGSFSRETSDMGTASTLIIDLPKIKQSYRATVSNDTSGYRGVYVTCLDANELIYEPFDCKDELNG